MASVPTNMALAARSWAILIGLDFYVNPSHRLQGAVRDADDMQAFLKKYHTPITIEKYISKDSGIPNQARPLGLEASWPTYDNIMGALDRIISTATLGDFVHIHFSGHGTLMPTSVERYQENLGSDAALVVYDSNGVDGLRYLLGIELASKFDAIVDKGVKLSVVLDCCNSGGVSRGDKPGDFRIRALPWNDSVADRFHSTNLPHKVLDEREGHTTDHWLLDPKGYILLAACGPNEIVDECTGNDGLPHGVFSYLLLNILTFASMNGYQIAFGAIHRQICAKIHIPYPGQHPVLIGDETVVFLNSNHDSHSTQSAKELQVRSTCNVINTFPNRTIRLDIGYAQGVCRDDEYLVFPVEIENLKGIEQSIVEIPFKIAEVHALESDAAPVDLSSDERVSTGWHAVLSRHARPKVAVRIPPDIDQAWSTPISQNLWLQFACESDTMMNIPFFQIETLEGFDKFMIRSGTHDEIQNLPVVRVSDRNAVQQIIIILEHLAKFAAIEQLDNQKISSTLGPDFFVIVLQDKDTAENSMTGNRLRVKEGTKVGITVKNYSDKALYVVVLIMTSLRQVKKLYPVDRQYRTVVRRTQDFRGEFSFSFAMALPKSYNAHWQGKVEDIIKIFVTDRPTSLSNLTMQSLEDAINDPHRGSDDVLFDSLQSYGDDPFNDVRRHDEAGAHGKWTCQNFIIEIIPPDL